MSQKKKLIVTGFGRHGKDTFCEMLEGIAGYSFTSSSWAAKEMVFAEIGEREGYQTPEECWRDRSNHRKEWYDLITAYNKPLSRLGAEIFQDFDVYCGIRNIDEFTAIRDAGLFDLSIWVDASSRGIPPEANDSMTIRMEDCDLVFDNGGSLEDLEKQVRSFYEEHLAG